LDIPLKKKILRQLEKRVFWRIFLRNSSSTRGQIKKRKIVLGSPNLRLLEKNKIGIPKEIWSIFVKYPVT
jgi:hypothetical protein